MTREAHPRSRGENASAPDAISCGAGSSPLTRGKLLARRDHHRRNGLIPAHAGKTARRSRARRPCRAHPRSRGENLKVSALPPATAGSSPLTRGKPHPGSHGVDRGRLIPAHAGKTPLAATRIRAMRAHPRSRGENLPWAALADKPAGSSPLTRGKPMRGGRANRNRGLIPAHAGKTRRWPCPRRAGAAHPRSRGENQGLTRDVAGTDGSSPLTRGKLDMHAAPS